MIASAAELKVRVKKTTFKGMETAFRADVLAH
jgi:hypothetical protein